ncbi:MAG: EAL domain-containing protein, partial [Hyphomicrobiales bacterium]
ANPSYFHRDAPHSMDGDLRSKEDFADAAPHEEHNKVEIDHSGHTHSNGVDSRLMGDFHTNPTDVNYVLTHVSYEDMNDTGSTDKRAGFLAINSRPAASGWQPDLRQIRLPGDAAGSATYLVAEVFHRLERGNDTEVVTRLVVDMSEISARNKAIGYFGGGTILGLLLLAFGYPTVRHFDNLRARRESDTNAHFLAHHDVLTGLSNRNAFQENVPKRLKQALAEGHVGVLFLLDVDNFKRINDFYGHHVGDQVLQKVAHMLRDQVPAGSMVARLGGDELAIVSFHDASEESISLNEVAFSSSFPVDMEGSEETFDVSFSIGVSRFPRDGTELSDLMRNADLALYDAKNNGKAMAREYLPEMKIGIEKRQMLFNEFRVGLKSSQIVPFYQPVICTRTGRVAGVEALVRWQHPQKGLICASDFSEVFEDREISELIGCQMIEKVTQNMARWKETNVPFERVGFNVNAANLLREGFVFEIINALTKHQLSPKELAIEVTEKTIFGTNSEALFDKLHELRRMGCEVVLDDFGTGYSSITHLKELPYTFLKIARTFISNIADDPEDQAIVSSLIELGKSLDYKMVAEGVETYEQYEKVRELGFHLSQGYYYSEPVSAEHLPSVIDAIRARSFRIFGSQEYQDDVA